MEFEYVTTDSWEQVKKEFAGMEGNIQRVLEDMIVTQGVRVREDVLKKLNDAAVSVQCMELFAGDAYFGPEWFDFFVQMEKAYGNCGAELEQVKMRVLRYHNTLEEIKKVFQENKHNAFRFSKGLLELPSHEKKGEERERAEKEDAGRADRKQGMITGTESEKNVEKKAGIAKCGEAAQGKEKANNGGRDATQGKIKDAGNEKTSQEKTRDAEHEKTGQGKLEAEGSEMTVQMETGGKENVFPDIPEIQIQDNMVYQGLLNAVSGYSQLITDYNQLVMQMNLQKQSFGYAQEEVKKLKEKISLLEGEKRILTEKCENMRNKYNDMIKNFRQFEE